MAIAPINLRLRGQDQTAKAFTSVQRRIGALRGAMSSLGGVIGVAFGAKAVRDQLNYADAMGKTARQLGGTVEFLSEAAAAAKLAGIETRTLTTGLQRMTRRVAEAAAGSSEFGKAFVALGLDAEKLKKLDLESQFRLIQQALGEVNNESERVRLAQKIFDSEGVVIARLAGQFDNLRVQAKNAGSTITTEFSNQAAVINDRVTTTIERLNNMLRGSVSLLFQMADGLGRVAARMVTGLDPSVAKQLRDNVSELRAELDIATAKLVATQSLGPMASRIWGPHANEVARLTRELGSAKSALEDFVKAESKVSTIAPFSTGPGDTAAAGGALPDAVLIQAKATVKKLENMIVTPTSAENYRRAAGEAGVYIEEISSKIITENDKTTTQLESGFSRWLQSSETGVKGLGQLFAQTLRGMVADAIASKLFQLLIPGGSFLGFSAPGRAEGGPVSRGLPYTVGERGPELFVPSTSGRILPNGASGGGGVQIINNIDARGADPSVLSRLPEILEANRRRTERDVVRMIREQRIQV